MLRTKALLGCGLLACAVVSARAQETPRPVVKTVEISPATADAEVGQHIKFTAVAKDADGKTVEMKVASWIAAPFDQASADDKGDVVFYNPGEIKVGAVIGGKIGWAKINVKSPPVSRIDVAPLRTPLLVGGTVEMKGVARISNGDPRNDAVITWTSETPAIARVDAAGMVTGVAAGKGKLKGTSEKGSTTVEISVVANPVARLAVTPASSHARTGDVIRFSVQAKNAAGGAVKNASVSWSVNGNGAVIDPDGGFYAEQPGTYEVRANVGQCVAVASIIVEQRNGEREIEIVGRIPYKDYQLAEAWMINDHAYISTIGDTLRAYDISDPAKPKQLGMLKVDSRTMNDVSTTPDEKIGVITREGASSRKNGIVFVDTSDAANLKIISEYTATVSGGVHSAYVNSHYVYLTDDSTGSLRIIDFADVKNPKEVARWEVQNPLVRTTSVEGEQVSSGRYLHDVQVIDGLAYLAYWRDGLQILDVGKGIKGGSPEHPKLVSELRFNYFELYGPGWLAGAHAVYRYKNYVFVGDEVFPGMFDISSRNRIPVRGIVHVVDVSDIEHPRKVAEYSVPESGSHNVWVLDDILYMGYYNGGGRVLDVSGELRGELYRQGREIAHLWTGDPEGFRPNLPFAWGAQPHKGLIYYNDINSGLWIAKLGKPKYKGSTTEPGN